MSRTLLRKRRVYHCRSRSAYFVGSSKVKSATYYCHVGIPPKATPRTRTLWATEDKGDFYKDPNAMCYPFFPLEPVVQAIFKTDGDFQSSEVGLVACGSTMEIFFGSSRKTTVPSLTSLRIRSDPSSRSLATLCFPFDEKTLPPRPCPICMDVGTAS